jgi:hypothetical protein
MEAASIRRSAGATALPLREGTLTKLRGERLAVGAAAAAIAMLPFLVPKGPANTAPDDALIGIALVACLVWAGTSGHRWRLPYVVPAGLLLIGGALGAAFGPVPREGAIALMQDAVLIAWCWALVNLSHSSANLRILLATWAYSAIGWVMLVYVGLATGSSALTGQVENQGSRVQLTLADPSHAANYFLVSIMIIWATGRPRNRGMRIAAYALLVSGIVLTGSNSGMLSLIVGTIVAAVLGVHNRFGILPATAALAFLVLGTYALASNLSLASIERSAHSSRYEFIRDGLGRGTSVDQRGMLLTESIELYRRGSPFGEGPVSTKPRLKNEMAPFAKEAHNDYLAALIERGALGFLGVALLVFGLVFRALSVTRAKLASGFSDTVTRPNALAGAVVGTLVAGTVYELLHVRHVWALYAFVAAVYLWGRK